MTLAQLSSIVKWSTNLWSEGQRVWWKELNVTDQHQILAFHLKRRSVTKDNLIWSWLETVCCIFSIHSVCCYAVPIVGRATELKAEKIDDESRNLDLQRYLIVGGENKLKAVHTTLQIKMTAEQLPMYCSEEVFLCFSCEEYWGSGVTEKVSRIENVVIYGMLISNKTRMRIKIAKVLIQFNCC